MHGIAVALLTEDRVALPPGARDTGGGRVGREFGPQRRFGHAWLRVDFEAEQPLSPRTFVVTEIRSTYAPTPERLMRLKGQSSDFLVNIWFKPRRKQVF